MDQINVVAQSREPWNKGVLVGQKAPLKLKKIWAMRIRLQIAGHTRDLALFNLANRPQAEGLRSGQVAGAGRMSWGSRRCPNDRYAAKDPAFRSIRDHGADAGGDCDLDQPCQSSIRGPSLPKPAAWLTASFYPSVRPHRCRSP